MRLIPLAVSILWSVSHDLVHSFSFSGSSAIFSIAALRHPRTTSNSISNRLAMSMSYPRLHNEPIQGFGISSGHHQNTCLKSKINMSGGEEVSSDDDGGTLEKKRIAKKNDIVTVELKLEPNGFVAEPLFDNQCTVSFVLGGGNYLPGLHDLIENMSVGDDVTDVSIDAGWGERNPNLMAKVSKEEQPSSGGLDYEKIKVGTELMLQSGINCVVTEVTDDYFMIDANPPLAGASYNCQLTLLQVESFPNDNVGYVENNDVGGNTDKYQVATFALGCFWGGELAFMREQGVVGTKVGYTQGNVPNPTYKDVCSGETGHTEAIQVVYDSTVVSFERLVTLAVDRLGDSIFLLNQVGNDVGTQYRHGIYYHSDEQKDVAERVLERTVGYKTEIKPAGIFYDAEDYHQQYLLKGGQSAKKGAEEYIRCYG